MFPGTKQKATSMNEHPGNNRNSFVEKLQETREEKGETESLKLANTFYRRLPLLKNLSARKRLAIDINTDRILYAVVKKSGSYIQVLKHGVEPLGTEELDRYRSIEMTLKYLRSKIYRKNMEVHVSFFSPDINIRQLILPHLKTADLEKAIIYKNRTEIPNFGDGDFWKYQILEVFREDGVEKCKILVTIVPEEVIEIHLDLLNRAGLKPAVLIPRSYALTAAYQAIVKRSKNDGNDVLVDIGTDTTQICFYVGGKLNYVRNFAVGANNLRKAIRTPGPGPEVTPQPQNGSNNEPHPEVQGSIRERLRSKVQVLKTKQNPLLQVLLSEIMRSLEFFKGKKRQTPIHKLFISGHGLKIESVIPYLKHRLPYPVYPLVPKFQPTTTEPFLNSEHLATIGTAMFEDKKMNMLPSEFRTRELYRNLSILTFAMIVIFSVYATFMYLNKKDEIVQFQGLISEIKAQYDQLNPAEKQYRQIMQQINQVAMQKRQLLASVKRVPELLQVLKLFSNEVPPEIRLTGLYFEPVPPGEKGVNEPAAADIPVFKYKVNIVGRITGDYLMGDIILMDFINHLRELNYFRRIELVDKRKQVENKLFEFEIEMYL